MREQSENNKRTKNKRKQTLPLKGYTLPSTTTLYSVHLNLNYEKFSLAAYLANLVFKAPKLSGVPVCVGGGGGVLLGQF